MGETKREIEHVLLVFSRFIQPLEIFLIDDEVRHMVNSKATTVELRKRAREMGMRTLREDGIRKVLSGMTTAEEVISVTMSDAS